jgi:hypothetical protein
VNEAPAGGNRRTVLIFTRTMTLALGLGLLSGGAGTLSGCAGMTGATGSLDGLEAGSTALRIGNHVSAPAELDRVSIVVDGEPIPLSSIPPEGGGLATVAVLRLKPGSHNIAVRARAHAPSGDVIVVGAQQPFLLQLGPAAITVDVRSGPAGAAESASPVAVMLTIQGGRMAPEFGVALSSDKDERCASLLPIPRALCRAAVDLDEASRKNDISAALCVRDKLSEMRKLALIGESGKGDSPAMAEAQVVMLSHQVELCIGEAAGSPAPDGLTVTRPRMQ